MVLIPNGCAISRTQLLLLVDKSAQQEKTMARALIAMILSVSTLLISVDCISKSSQRHGNIALSHDYGYYW